MKGTSAEKLANFLIAALIIASSVGALIYMSSGTPLLQSGCKLSIEDDINDFRTKIETAKGKHEPVDHDFYIEDCVKCIWYDEIEKQLIVSYLERGSYFEKEKIIDVRYDISTYFEGIGCGCTGCEDKSDDVYCANLRSRKEVYEFEVSENYIKCENCPPTSKPCPKYNPTIFNKLSHNPQTVYVDDNVLFETEVIDDDGIQIMNFWYISEDLWGETCYFIPAETLATCEETRIFSEVGTYAYQVLVVDKSNQETLSEIEFVKVCEPNDECVSSIFCEIGGTACDSVRFTDDPPYNLLPLGPYDEMGIYCSGKIKEMVDNCISLHASKLDRVKCLVEWSYNNFPDVYDDSGNCKCIKQKGLTPNDVVECTITKSYPSGCSGCGQCTDFASALYSLLISCGLDCDIDTDNLFIAHGFLFDEVEEKCYKAHTWLLYDHPNEDWVFIEPTDPTFVEPEDYVDEYFIPISKYPCITFYIENLDYNPMYSTLDEKISDEDCTWYDVGLEGCPE